MTSRNLPHKTLLEPLYAALKRQLSEQDAERVYQFASIYYASVSAEELAERRLDDLYGATLECWQFMQTREAGQPRVRVFNPDFESNGWQSTHTVIVLLQTDMPFLIDSVRMELNRRGLTIHSIQNAIVAVKRGADQRLQQVLESNSAAAELPRESLIYFEVDRHTNPRALQDLSDHIEAVLAEVTLVTDDFIPMRKQAQMHLSEIETDSDVLTEADRKECMAFLRWIIGDSFTFLGYEEYRVTHRGDTVELELIAGKELGLLKLSDEHSRNALVSTLSVEKKLPVAIESMLNFGKSPTRSRVHRPAYPDYIILRKFDKKGRVTGERRYLGLYTSTVYIQSSTMIPVVRLKVNHVLERAGLHPGSHDWKEMQQILEIYPRDDLFQIDTDELYTTALGILHIHERRQVRLFLRRDHFGRFYSCLVYAPRDIYSTDFRMRVQDILTRELGSKQVEFSTYFSESILARTQFILHLDEGSPETAHDIRAIEKRIVNAARSWSDILTDALIEEHGEERGIALANRYRRGFPSSYRDDCSPRTAVADIQHMGSLGPEQTLTMSFYRALEQSGTSVQLKLFHFQEPIPLSDVIPVLENLGLRVINERPYLIRCADNQRIWIHDFSLQHSAGETFELHSVKQVFQDAFLQIWNGRCGNDAFNKLVLAARLSWREVSMLRAYAAYMKQINVNFSQDAIAAALTHQASIASLLVQLFVSRFDPRQLDSAEEQACHDKIVSALDAVPSLTEDRIIRRYLDLIRVTLRTNFFQYEPGAGAGQQSQFHDYLSFKLSPRQLADIPKPRPMYEIFVYSPRVEGVHLRGGPVARGGLRWSDRLEDYRTEVLGLVKAQQVKNAVIVPVGAKGGFVPKLLAENATRDQRLEEGVACYQIFIRGLLDITDNLNGADIVKPRGVVCHDSDDPYLVVAADKGTAAFSDIANTIAREYGFWLDDAFASGGGQGYDHKKMGITARGAWVSVERHFLELGLDTRASDFRVVGIGDMSGDVFGNGMLLSEHICLVAAFNHQHIFIDPAPVAATSFAERKRLFELPRSSWSDYDESLISAGGGVFSRAAKSLAITPQMQQCFAITATRLTPSELISALLKAPVDLLWNGGIGTYVKSSSENHSDVGDKANDNLRVDATELRCRVIGEGGNLGITQLARVEYAMRGGACNTDFIDNAGGVDCSDHEVNIKILLNQIVADGDMTVKQRNQLLVTMTDSVADLVLQNNYHQALAISIAEQQAREKMGEYQRLISAFEHQGQLDRALEYLPSEEVLSERAASGVALTRPELSLLISYTKGVLKEAFAHSSLPEDVYMSQALKQAFPASLAERFAEQLQSHRLSKEIVATQIANKLVNQMGITYVHRLQLSTGAEPEVIAKAYVLARDIYQFDSLQQQVEGLDRQVAGDVQLRMLLELQRLIRRASRWFLRNRRSELDVVAEVSRFAQPLSELSEHLGEWLQGAPAQQWQDRFYYYQQAGVPQELAAAVANAEGLYIALGMIEVAQANQCGLQSAVTAYCTLSERLDLFWFSRQIAGLNVQNHWQALAREAFRDDLDWQVRAIASGVLGRINGSDNIEESFSSWSNEHELLVKRWLAMLSDLKATETPDYSMFTVAIRELFDLAKGASLAEKSGKESE